MEDTAEQHHGCQEKSWTTTDAVLRMRSSSARLLEGAEYWRMLVFVICFSRQLKMWMVVSQERQGQEEVPCLPFVLVPRLVVPGDLAEYVAVVRMVAPATLAVKTLTV